MTSIADIQPFFHRNPGLRVAEGLPTDEVYPPGTCGVYRAIEDAIYLLPRTAYKGGAGHYTLSAFHEVIHATGHPSRLNRPAIRSTAQGAPAPRMEYLFEEMIAELGALFLTHELREENSAPIILNAVNYVSAYMIQVPEDQWTYIFDGVFKQAMEAARVVLGRHLMKTADI